jgi:hypothetical protein
MRLGAVLVGLVVLATAGFVVGTSIERDKGESRHESAATLKAEGGSTHGHAEGTAAETATSGERTGSNAAPVHHAELKPLGVNVEAVPFIVLAAAGSIALAGAVWLRPRWVPLLLGVAAAMLIFAVLDVREVVHQSDESRTGLATLAGAVAALHAGAAIVAALLARRAAGSSPEASAGAATMPG